jgi:PD-(D/E)XK endonuclease
MDNMAHPKSIGDHSILAVMIALDEAGYRFLLPMGENTRYDLVIDDQGRFSRVQCKTGRLRSGAVRFNACSFYGHHPNPQSLSRHYLGEIDYFAVYCPETSGVYLIPIEDIPLRRQGALRVDPPRNGQRRRIRLASTYEIGRVRVTAAPGGIPGALGSCA